MRVVAVMCVLVLGTARLCRGHNYGSAAYLTELIKAGKVDEARREASVSTTIKAGLSSYAGYITVKEPNTTLYFWFFPSENGGQQDPVVLWLPSTLGESAIVTLFEENGPVYIGLKKGLKTRSYYLSKVAGVIYVDSPVGAGFSFTTDPKGYSQDFASVSANLYEFLRQFFTIFPDLVKCPFYIAGQGQACPSVVGLADLIDKKNPSAPLKINLSGLVIGNGFCDPVSVVPKTKALVGLGLLTPTDNQAITAEQSVLRQLSQQKWNDAFDAYDAYAMGTMTPYPTLLANKTGFPTLGNLVEPNPNFNFGDLEYFLREKDVLRRSIHAGSLEFDKLNKTVLSMLRGQLMQGVVNQLGSVMSKYSVLFYNGQLNGQTTLQAQTDSQAKLPWCGSRYYDANRRVPWMANNTLYGYQLTVKVSSCKGSMLQTTILNSGDNPFTENPASAVDFILGFLTSKHYKRGPL